MVGEPVAIHKLDMKTCTFEDVKGVPPTKFAIEITGDAPVRVSGAFQLEERGSCVMTSTTTHRLTD